MYKIVNWQLAIVWFYKTATGNGKWFFDRNEMDYRKKEDFVPNFPT
jgi:hypothetical protein